MAAIDGSQPNFNDAIKALIELEYGSTPDEEDYEYDSALHEIAVLIKDIYKSIIRWAKQLLP
ncbi:MAG: hypothetical protein K0R14_1916 [Burkholderiales bacterium]|jgi:hypothetical protein|nr:hypothetical protein [Burkholderiales bacterium]